MRGEALRSEASRDMPEDAAIAVPKGPRGRVITIVGPDGSGKTTLSAALVEGVLADRPVLVLANRRGAGRPGLLPHRKVRGDTRQPHRYASYPAWVSVPKTLYLFADFALGRLIRVRPFLRRGGWVIVERGWWDVMVDPMRYRLRPFPMLGRVLGRMMPRSDLVLVLDAPPAVIEARKAQLSPAEVERQRQAWHELLPPRQPRFYIDASCPAEEVAREASLELGRLERGARDPALSLDVVEGNAEAGARWLPLLRRLSERFPLWVVWKNADAALGGVGDMDVLAPAEDWDGIAQEFVRWSREQSLSPVLECRHVPGSMYLAAADPAGARPFELDVKALGAHRGATIFRPADLAPFTSIDPRGFRRLRPGAEGILKLVLNGVRRNAGPRADRIARESIPELVASDPEGLREAAHLFGAAGPAARRGAEAVAGGRWRRRDMLAVEAWARVRAAIRPGILLRRARFRLTGTRVCPGIKGLRKGNPKVFGDPTAWPTEILEQHTVGGVEGKRDAPAGPGRGGVVMIAGPDGVGKTTLSFALANGLFAGIPVRRVHHARGLGVFPHHKSAPGSSSEPHGRPPYPRWLSTAKLFYLYLDFRIGWLLNIRPFVRRGGWVLIQRHWWDIVVDPARYRLRSAGRLGKMLGRLLPKPDLVLILEASPGVIAGRKSELPEVELARQLRAWRESLPSGQRRAYLDATLPIEDVVRRATDEIQAVTQEVNLGSRGWINLPGRGSRARFILPRAPRAAVTSALRIYHPVNTRGRLGSRLARLASGLGLLRLLPRGAAPSSEVLRVLQHHIPRNGTVAVARTNHSGRALALLLEPGGSCRAVAKVATQPEGRPPLRDEAERLTLLGPLLPPPLSPPTLLSSEDGLMLLAPVPWRLRPEPWRLSPDVAFALGTFFRAGMVDGDPPTGPVHGDVAPWNLLLTDHGWVLLDWEEARPDGLPFHDPVHHLVQSAVLLGRPSPEALLAGLRGRGWIGHSLRAYASGAGLQVEEGPRYFVSYLRSRLERLDPTTVNGAKGIRILRGLLRCLAEKERPS